MTLIKKHEREGYRAIEMQGLIHTMLVMDANSDITPVLITIDRAGETISALLDEDDVDALHEFLSQYITKEQS